MRGCLTLLVGIVIGAGLALYLVRSQTSRAVTTPPATSDVKITLSDAYLARRIAQRASQLQAPTITQVALRGAPPNTILASATATLGPVSTPLSLDLVPQAAGSGVRVTITGAHLAGIPVPSALTGVVASEINKTTQNLLGSGARVQSVRVLPSALVIWANYG